MFNFACNCGVCQNQSCPCSNTPTDIPLPTITPQPTTPTTQPTEEPTTQNSIQPSSEISSPTESPTTKGNQIPTQSYNTFSCSFILLILNIYLCFI